MNAETCRMVGDHLREIEERHQAATRRLGAGVESIPAAEPLEVELGEIRDQAAAALALMREERGPSEPLVPEPIMSEVRSILLARGRVSPGEFTRFVGDEELDHVGLYIEYVAPAIDNLEDAIIDKREATQ